MRPPICDKTAPPHLENPGSATVKSGKCEQTFRLLKGVLSAVISLKNESALWNFRIYLSEVFRISALENHPLNCTDKEYVTWYLSVARSGGYATVVRYTTDVEVLSQIQASERTRSYTTVLVTSHVQLTCNKRTMLP